jgi:hypothetical protein
MKNIIGMLIDEQDLAALSLEIAEIRMRLDRVCALIFPAAAPLPLAPLPSGRAPVRRAARKPDSKPTAKAARPADGAHVCIDCQKPIKGSPLKKRCPACIKTYTRTTANAAYHAKHAKKPDGQRSAVSGQRAEVSSHPKQPSAFMPTVSDAARKIAALREAREIEKARIADIPHDSHL